MDPYNKDLDYQYAFFLNLVIISQVVMLNLHGNPVIHVGDTDIWVHEH